MDLFQRMSDQHKLTDDALLYEEGMRRLNDESLLHWYARLDMPTRHRLLAVANEKAADTSPLLNMGTLSAVLMMLIASGAYRQELLLIEDSALHAFDTAMWSKINYLRTLMDG